MTNDHLYRIRSRNLRDKSLSAEELASRVETFASKTMSDGITTDNAGNVYLTDPEHFAIVALAPNGNLRTLVKDPLLRWPDGLSFGPDGWLYVAPYQIFRLKPGTHGIPGH